MSNDIKWIILHKTTSNFEAEALKGNLEAQGIPAIILNKKDSSYNTFGYVEVHVDKSRIEEAEALLKRENTAND